MEARPVRPTVNRRRWLRLGLAATVVAAGAAVAILQLRRTSLPTPPAPPLLPQPAAAPPPAPTHIRVAYSTEKRDWIEAVTADFGKSHPAISVELVGAGSFESAREILDGRLQPTVWTPSDSALLKLLATDWQAKNRGELFAPADDAAQPLLLTPLVFIVWEDRARVLRKSAGGTIDWKTLRQGIISAKGWPAIGGEARWGAVKLGHTDPTQSNSGLQALYLMLLEHNGKLRLSEHDLANPKHLGLVRGLEQGVAKLESSTGVLATDMLRFGPSKYDIAVVYESTAIAELGGAEGRWGKLTISYPATTLWSDNPAVVLAAPWVSEAQAGAARQYLAFLRSKPAQEQALAHGFRPADTTIKIITDDSQNPFVRFADRGLTVEVPPAAEMPDGAALRSLMALWSRALRPAP